MKKQIRITAIMLLILLALSSCKEAVYDTDFKEIDKKLFLSESSIGKLPENWIGDTTKQNVSAPKTTSGDKLVYDVIIRYPDSKLGYDIALGNGAEGNWISSNNEIATVDKYGTVTCTGNIGNAEISLNDKSCWVFVIEPEVYAAKSWNDYEYDEYEYEDLEEYGFDEDDYIQEEYMPEFYDEGHYIQEGNVSILGVNEKKLKKYMEAHSDDLINSGILPVVQAELSNQAPNWNYKEEIELEDAELGDGESGSDVSGLLGEIRYDKNGNKYTAERKMEFEESSQYNDLVGIANIKMNWKYVYYDGKFEIPDVLTYHGQKYLVENISGPSYYNSYPTSNIVSKVGIPSGVRLIRDEYVYYSDKSTDSNAFSGMKSLEGFDVSSLNQSYMVQDGVLFSKDGSVLVSYPSGKQDSKYSLPESVETIAAGAIRNNPYLEEIIFSPNLRDVKTGNLSNMSALSKVTIPPDANIKEIDGMILDKDETKLFALLRGTNTIDIPSSVAEIDENIFKDNTFLKELNIHSTINSLELNDCTALEFVNITGSIGRLSIDGCKNLASLILDGEVETAYLESGREFVNFLWKVPLNEKEGELGIKYCLKTA